MSYDLTIFVPLPDATEEDICAYFASDPDEWDEDEDAIEVIDDGYSEEEIRQLAFRPLMRFFLGDAELPASLDAFLDSGDSFDLPDDLPDDLASSIEEAAGMIDDSISDGRIDLMFSFGGVDEQLMRSLFALLVELNRHGMIAYDPQLDRVIDVSEGPEPFLRAFGETRREMLEAFQKMYEEAQDEDE